MWISQHVCMCNSRKWEFEPIVFILTKLILCNLLLIKHFANLFQWYVILISAVFMFRGQIKSSKWSSQPSVSHTWARLSTLFSFIASFILPVCLENPLLFVILDTVQSAASGTRLNCRRTALTFKGCGTIFSITRERKKQNAILKLKFMVLQTRHG